MKGKKALHILASILVTSLMVYGIAGAASPEPGSSGDPLVTKSYVDREVSLLLQEINTLKAEINALKGSGGTGGTGDTGGSGGTGGTDTGSGGVSGQVLFNVVTVPAGKSLIAGEGTEIVVRVGNATAISGEKGDGLADVTAGLGTKYDLKTGQAIPVNHLLIVSRDDGRGFKAVTNVTALVKGPYTIK